LPAVLQAEGPILLCVLSASETSVLKLTVASAQSADPEAHSMATAKSTS